MATIGIVGAGVSGVVCAYELQKAGFDVTLFEKDKLPGGRSHSRSKDGLTFDTGAQMLSNSYSEVINIGKEFDLLDEWRILDPTGHWIVLNKELIDVSFQSMKQFLTFNHIPRIAQLRLMLFFLKYRLATRPTPFYNLEYDGPSRDSENTYDFLKAWAGEEVAEYVGDTFVSAYQFHGADEFSSRIFKGIISLFSPEFTYDYTESGIGEYTKRIAEKLNIHYETPVQQIERSNSGGSIVTQKEKRHFDQVIVATQAPITKKIYLNPTDDQQRVLDTVRYASTIVVGYRVPHKPVADVAMVGVPREESSTITSYIPQSIKGYVDTRTDTTLMNVFLRDSYAKSLMKEDDKVIYESVKQEFLPVCPRLQPYADQFEPYDLQRWPCAMPIFFEKSIQTVHEFLEKGQGRSGVYLCGDYLNAPWMEGATRRGIKIAAEVKALLAPKKEFSQV